MESQNLTQAQAAQMFNVTRPRISELQLAKMTQDCLIATRSRRAAIGSQAV
ncbi:MULTISPECIES: XRE family transcriptional regulator [Pseudomonas]|uniref:XRE family transcriptional regulator n=1 Tax=Pseudomonas TaxID=286 RepID=UPI000EFFFA38|nr:MULTISPECIES: hypothetical protein [Pseudomonas]